MHKHNLDVLLRDRFGFSAFRREQRDVVEHLFAGRSAAAVFESGRQDCEHTEGEVRRIERGWDDLKPLADLRSNTDDD
jgi:hypothetical protein